MLLSIKRYILYYETRYFNWAYGLQVGGEIGCNWFTTLSVERPVEKKLVLSKTYNENNYPRFDNDPEIIESKSKDIPIDYLGKIAVPITFFKYYIYLPYDILELRRGLKLKGKEMFSRLIIRRKQK